MSEYFVFVFMNLAFFHGVPVKGVAKFDNVSGNSFVQFLLFPDSNGITLPEDFVHQIVLLLHFNQFIFYFYFLFLN